MVLINQYHLCHNRDEWCSYQNFKTMYHLVYKAKELAGIAQKLPEAQW